MPDNEKQQDFILPVSIAQPRDIGRLLREIGLIDEHLNQEAIRDPNKRFTVKASLKLDELLKTNNIDITDKHQRSSLTQVLEYIRKNSPKVNVSFCTEANEKFTQKIAEWFRREVDPYCLIVVGLEPNIGIGSIVRTTNKVFDFSLKSRLKFTADMLIKDIKSLDIQGPTDG